jgi:hypothetical protein
MKAATRILATSSAVALLTAAGACSDIFGGGRRPSSFRASMSFSEGGTESYQGRGSFYVGPDVAAGVRMRFDINSTTEGDSAPQSFGLHRRGGGIPEPGTYVLTSLDFSNPNEGGTTALYTRVANGWTEAYKAQAGELRVTSASRDHVEGTFRFVGFRYCASERIGTRRIGPCIPVAEPIPGAPTIEVEGTFSVVPFDDSDIETMPGIERIPR